MKLLLDSDNRDYNYFSEKAWFDSDYFYKTKIGPLKKLAGKLFDNLAILFSKNK